MKTSDRCGADHADIPVESPGDIGSNTVGELVHQREPVLVEIILRGEDELTVGERAHDILVVPAMLREFLLNVGGGFRSGVRRNSATCQGDAKHGPDGPNTFERGASKLALYPESPQLKTSPARASMRAP